MKDKKRVLAVSVMGNMLELYDFALYGVFAGILAQVFFPSSNPVTSLLSSLGAFSAGIIMRPFGAMLFGYIGDRFGRRRALTFSIFLSAFPMLVIGLMPSYDTIGITAPCLVMISRMAQGLAFGGEYNGAAIFTLEHLSRSKSRTFPGMAGGIISTSSSLGVLFAVVMGAVVSSFPEITWLWRMPFVLGSLIGLIGFYIRYKVLETPEFSEIKNPSHSRLSFIQVFKKYPKSCIATFALGGFVGAITYTCMGFFNVYMSRYLDIPLPQAMAFTLYTSITCVIFCPIFGYISDFFDRRVYFMTATLGILTLTPVVFTLLQMKTFFSIVASQVIFGMIYSCVGGPQHAFIQRLFPVEARYTGVAVSYCTGGAVFGGLTPVALTFLIEKTGNLDMPVVVISVCAIFLILSLVNLGSINNETKKFDEFRKVA